MGKITLLIAFLTSLVACKNTQVSSTVTRQEERVIIYRTHADHYEHVPVTLNEAKDRLSSFPAPSDLFYEGELALPVKLKDGFLLDRRGIGPLSAFTSYTYEEYSKLQAPPGPQELLESVIDRDPFESLYDCGKAGTYKNLVSELNAMIGKDMEGCQSLISKSKSR